MTVQQIAPLFTLFSGVEELNDLRPLLQSGIDDVAGRLRPGADPADSRLAYLAAAIANLRHSQLLAARQQALYTAAGTVPKADGAGNRPAFAEALVREYARTAQPLLQDDAFVFAAVGGMV